MGLETAAIIGIAGAAAAVGTSVVSAISSSNAVDKANEANERLMREQMAYQTSEREAAEEYNSQANQRARFEAAGINPYLAFGNIDSGNTTAQTGVAPPEIKPNLALANMMQDLGGQSSDLLGKYESFQNIQAKEEAIKQARVDTIYKGRDKLLDLSNKASDIAVKMSNVNKGSAEYDLLRQQYNKLDREIKSLDIDLKYQEGYNSARNKREENMAGLVYEQKREAFWKADLAQQTAEAFPQLNQKQLDLLSAQAFSAIKSGELSSEMSETEKVKRVGEILANGIQANEFTLSQLGLTQAELDAARKGDVSKLRKNSSIFRLIDDGIDYVAERAGMVLGFAAGSVSKGLKKKPTKVKGF